jgi:hypothetical protein
MTIAHMLLTVIRALCKGRSSLALEDLALRQQLAGLKRSVKRPKLRRRDRLFWALLNQHQSLRRVDSPADRRGVPWRWPDPDVSHS